MVSVFLLTTGLRAGESSELDKRKAFAKAYTVAKAEDRVAAVQLLSGCNEDASFLCLVKVAKIDAEPSVRLSAYNLITQWDDPMGRLERVLLDIFLNEKNRATKISMCEAFPKLKTKSAAIEATIKLFNTCTYPSNSNRHRDRHRDYNRGNGSNGGAVVVTRRRSAKSIAASRQQFSDVLGVLNSLTGQSFPTSNRARVEVKKWWILNQAEFIKADAATQKKLAAEARVAANKRNKQGNESDIE
jgi:hypothetical protein